MSVILWIIGIIIVISILGEIIRGIGENIGKLIGGIIVIVLAIVAFKLIGKLLGWLVHWIHYLICLIPKGLLYGYIFIFLAAIVLWFGICILNVSLKYALEDVLFTYRYLGTETEIKKMVRENLLKSHSGLMSVVIKSQRYERMFYSVLQDSSYHLKQRYCTYVVFEEFASVLDSLGMATDKEMLEKIQSEQGYSLEVVEITKNLEDFYCCLLYLVNTNRAELVPLNQEEEGDYYYEPKLYTSTHPSPSPENMLPTQTYEFDDL